MPSSARPGSPPGPGPGLVCSISGSSDKAFSRKARSLSSVHSISHSSASLPPAAPSVEPSCPWGFRALTLRSHSGVPLASAGMAVSAARAWLSASRCVFSRMRAIQSLNSRSTAESSSRFSAVPFSSCWAFCRIRLSHSGPLGCSEFVTSGSTLSSSVGSSCGDSEAAPRMGSNTSPSRRLRSTSEMESDPPWLSAFSSSGVPWASKAKKAPISSPQCTQRVACGRFLPPQCGQTVISSGCSVTVRPFTPQQHPDGHHDRANGHANQ